MLGHPQVALDTVRPMDHTEAFHELRSPTGGTLFGCFPARGRWVAALQVYRRDNGSGSRRTDVAFLQSVSARIGEGLAAAARREALRADDDLTAPPLTGVVVFDTSGRRAFQTPAGARWLAALGGDGVELPEPVLAAIARAKVDRHGAGLVHAGSPFGPVRVEASQADDGGYALVLTPVNPAAAALVPLAWDLTAAERRVVELALRGPSNVEIAA